MKHFKLLHQGTGQDIGVSAPTAEIAVVHAHRVFPDGTGDSRTIFERPLGIVPAPQMAAVTPEQAEEILASPEYQTITRGRWSVACGAWATFSNGRPSREEVRAALR